MPITQVDIEGAEQLLNELLGNADAAEEYAKDPQGWLGEHGYADLNPEAIAQVGAGYGSGAAAFSGTGATSVAAAVDPVVYNRYYEIDNSITNNIENNGNLDFNQQVGDGNVNVNDSTVEGDIQSQTGDGIQINDSTIDDSNLSSGDDNQQAIDQSTNTEVDVDLDLPDPPADAPDGLPQPMEAEGAESNVLWGDYFSTDAAPPPEPAGVEDAME